MDLMTKIRVLIDDDSLVHMTWELLAKKQGIELHTYFSIEEFLKQCQNYDKSTEIYIDSNLSDGVKGEIESIDGISVKLITSTGKLIVPIKDIVESQVKIQD